ncbi:MAG TPA: aquaporin [Puia sp.]
MFAIDGCAAFEALFAGPVCRASMNPTRSLSLAIIVNHYQSLWIYVLPPVLGAILGSFVFLVIIETRSLQKRKETV